MCAAIVVKMSISATSVGKSDQFDDDGDEGDYDDSAGGDNRR